MIYALVVIYNKKCEESISLRRLEEYKNKNIKIIVFDNSDKDLGNENYCNKKQTFEQILKYIFDEYGLTMNSNQYILIGSTIKSYLSYLYDNSKISYEFKDNIMYWRTIC